MKSVKRFCKQCSKNVSNLYRTKKFCDDSCKKEFYRNFYQQKNLEKILQNSNPKDLITCKICAFQGKDLAKHIGVFHKMPVEEYKIKYNVIHIRNDSYLKQQSERIKGNKNPGYQHNGKFSKLSKNYIHGFSQKEKENISKKIGESNSNNDKRSNCLSYWLKKTGGDELLAKELLSEKQATFSKEKCILKYGKEKGIKVWEERQRKWNSSYKKTNYSKISQTLFKLIYKKIKKDFKEIFFATKGKKHINNEYVLENGLKPDFLILDIKKIIEFDGDYWHGEKRGNKERDLQRDIKIKNLGFDIFHVKEKDYKKDPKGTLEKCLNFLKNQQPLSENI